MENTVRPVLIDHNIEWQATLLWSTLKAEGWLELYPLEILMFHDVVAEPKRSCDSSEENVRNVLQYLYDKGFVSVSLEDALNDNIRIPRGKKPVVFTVDDFFYNENFLKVYKDFVKEHPDFGLNASFFVNGYAGDINLSNVLSSGKKT